MSDAKDERIITDSRRRLLWRGLLNVLASFAALATELVLGLGFHMITQPLRWQPITLVSGIALLVGLAGITTAWWLTRLPPEALTERIALRQSDRIQRLVSRVLLFFPVIMGVFGVIASGVVIRVLDYGWQLIDVVMAAGVLTGAASYLPFLTGWGAARRARRIYDEELFLSFRKQGYIAGFWSVMGGLLLVLALGLARPAWAVEALPVLIAIGLSVPALTIARLNRRAERDV